jgi:hypothetical protein
MGEKKLFGFARVINETGHTVELLLPNGTKVKIEDGCDGLFNADGSYQSTTLCRAVSRSAIEENLYDFRKPRRP